MTNDDYLELNNFQILLINILGKKESLSLKEFRKELKKRGCHPSEAFLEFQLRKLLGVGVMGAGRYTGSIKNYHLVTLGRNLYKEHCKLEHEN